MYHRPIHPKSIAINPAISFCLRHTYSTANVKAHRIVPDFTQIPLTLRTLKLLRALPEFQSGIKSGRVAEYRPASLSLVPQVLRTLELYRLKPRLAHTGKWIK